MDLGSLDQWELRHLAILASAVITLRRFHRSALAGFGDHSVRFPYLKRREMANTSTPVSLNRHCWPALTGIGGQSDRHTHVRALGILGRLAGTV